MMIRQDRQQQDSLKEEARLREQIARLENSALLTLVEACEQLYRDLGQNLFSLTLSKEQMVERDTLRVQVKQVKTLLEQERGKRMLRGCQEHWRHLLVEIHQQPQSEREMCRILPYPVQTEPVPSAPLHQDAARRKRGMGEDASPTDYEEYTAEKQLPTLYQIGKE